MLILFIQYKQRVIKMKPKMGRPTLRARPLTGGELKLRQRRKTAFKVQAANEGGCKVIPVLMNNNQLLTLKKLYFAASNGVVKIGDRKLEEIVYHALKLSIEALKVELKQWDIPEDIINLCDSTNYPEDLNALNDVQVQANLLFEQWESTQQESAQ